MHILLSHADRGKIIKAAQTTTFQMKMHLHEILDSEAIKVSHSDQLVILSGTHSPS